MKGFQDNFVSYTTFFSPDKLLSTSSSSSTLHATVVVMNPKDLTHFWIFLKTELYKMK